MESHVQAAGFAWFEEDDYEAFKSVLPDRKWHRTFGEWEAVANQRFESLTNEGIRAIKAKVRSEAFVDWCRATGRNVDSQALVAWGNEAAYRAVTGQY